MKKKLIYAVFIVVFVCVQLSQSWPCENLIDREDALVTGRLVDLLSKNWLITHPTANSTEIIYELAYCGASDLCPSEASVCQIRNDADNKKAVSTSLGLKSTTRLSKYPANGGYELVTNGTDASSSVTVYFTCSKTMGTPRLVVDNDSTTAGGSIIIYWATNQACPNDRFISSREVPCFYTSTDVFKYRNDSMDYVTVDFDALVLTKSITSNDVNSAPFHQVVEFNDIMDVFINLCRYESSSKCPGEYAACVTLNEKEHITFGFKNNSGSLIKKLSNGRYVIEYEVLTETTSPSVKCAKDAKLKINLMCPRTRSGSKSPMLKAYNDDECDFEIDWYTQHACGTRNYVQSQSSCRLSDPKSNLYIDLSPLNKPDGYSTTYDKYEYRLNPCGPLTLNSKSSAAQLVPTEPNFLKSIGSFVSSSLRYIDGELVLTLNGGEKCGTNVNRQTIVHFSCSNQTGNLMFAFEKDCSYYFRFETELACVNDCAVEYNNNLYDLTALTKSDGQFWSVIGDYDRGAKIPFTHVILNVCAGLNLNSLVAVESKVVRAMKLQCRGQTSVCAFNNYTGVVSNLGEFRRDLDLHTDELGTSYLRLVYDNGDPCARNVSAAKRTIVNFVCDANSANYAGLDGPRLTYVSDDGCESEIVWRTREACEKTRLVSGSECVIESNGRVLFNLTSLANESVSFEAVHDHDLDAGADVDQSVDTSLKYVFQICGRRVVNYAKSQLTFLTVTGGGLSTVFEFSKPPRLIYDNELLYFKYENSSAHKWAYVKLECSYETSISVNSFDYRLMMSLFKSDNLMLNFDDDLAVRKSVAFVLWKTPRACATGSNELANHFKPYVSNAFETVVSSSKCIVYDGDDLSLHPLDAQMNPIDLRILLKKYRADERDLEVTIEPNVSKFYTRLCDLSFRCSASSNSYGCLVLNGTRMINLASELTSTKTIGADLLMTYGNGEPCGTSNLTYSFEILLKCAANIQSRLKFIRLSESNCKYHFEWLTNHVCRGLSSPPVTESTDCRVTDRLVDADLDLNNNYNSHTYDLSQLAERTYNLPLRDNYSMIVSVCGPLDAGLCSSEPSGSCFYANNTGFNQGRPNGRLANQNGLLAVTYTNGTQCPFGPVDRNSSTRVEFYCDYNEALSQLKYLHFIPGKCQHVVGYYTYLACPPYLSRQNIDFKCYVRLDEKRQTSGQMTFAQRQNGQFRLRFGNYRLEFRLCGLLPSSEMSQGSNHGRCFDRYGNALGSACLYDENHIEEQLANGDTVVRQTNLGLAKGPFVKSADEQLKLTYYVLAFTEGDVCAVDPTRRMQLNVLFKCDRSTGQYADIEGNNYRANVTETGDKCKLNIIVEMWSFCQQAESLENSDPEYVNENALSVLESDSCSFSQKLAEQAVKIYNLTQIGDQIYKVFDQLNKITYAFRICGTLPAAECAGKSDSSVCIGESKCTFSKNAPHIMVIEDSYRLRLTFNSTSGDCANAKNTQLIVDILCDAKTGGSAVLPPDVVYKSSTADRLNVEIHSLHSCPEIKFIQANNLHQCKYLMYIGKTADEDLDASNLYSNLNANTQMDLSEWQLSISSHDSTSPMSVFDAHDTEFEFEFNFCSVSKTKCNQSAAICMINHLKTGQNGLSLGSLTSASIQSNMYFRRFANSLYFLFKNGSTCGDNVKLTYSSQVQLVCSVETKSPELLYYDPLTCRYFFRWANSMACLGADDDDDDGKPVVSTQCRIYNRLHNHTFDLSELFVNPSEPYRLKTNREEYSMNVCAPAGYNGTSVAIKRLRDNSTFGFFNKMEINHITSYVLVNYEGEPCPSEVNQAINRNVIILFECSPYGDMKPVVEEEDECHLTVRWPVKAACIRSAVELSEAKCSVYYANNLYDLKPLSHNLDSWKVSTPKGDDQYWMNICRGVVQAPDRAQCPPDASVCVRHNATGQFETLAYLSQMDIELRDDANSIDLVFNNSKRACGQLQPYTLVLIRFKCSTTIGRPELESNLNLDTSPSYLRSSLKECILAFEWKTRVACKNSTKISSQVDLHDGILIDSAHTDVRINLTDIFLNSTAPFEDKNDFNSSLEYFVQFTGENSRCPRGVKICQVNVDTNQTVDLGSYIEYSSFDVYSQLLEVSLKSNTTSCKSIIRFYCEPSANSSSGFRFESQSDECVYMFDWPLRRLCVLNDWLNNSQSANSTKTNVPAIMSSSRIPSIVVVFAFLCILVLLLVMFNNHEYIANMRVWTIIGSACAQLRQVSWFGTTSRRMARFSTLRNRPRRAETNRRVLAGVKYKRLLKQNGNSQTYDLDDDDENDDLANSSSDEITALFTENDEQNVLRLSELEPNGQHALHTPNQTVPERRRGLDHDERPITRQDSKNNMISNVETDDDLINIS